MVGLSTYDKIYLFKLNFIHIFHSNFLLEKYFRNIFVSLAHKSLVYKSRATRLRIKKFQPANATPEIMMNARANSSC